MMRNSFLIAGFFLVPIGFGSLAFASSHEVQMKSLSFSPKTVELKEGEEVVWKNVSLTPHDAKSDDGVQAFETGMVDPGKASKAIRFEKAGHYPYHCGVHGKTMSGEIVVQAKSK
jgi:plastocyanin